MAALPTERHRRIRTFRPGGSAASLQDAHANGTPLLDLASNDYLGLARHPALARAATACLNEEGLGAGSSRLVCGSRPIHEVLERALAHWLGRERVLLFPSGFQANLAAVTALADRHSLVLADRLIHHSLLVGVQASGARLQRFRHNDLRDLDRRLLAARQADPGRRLLVLSESLFSMEGTNPPVEALARLCGRHGALLLLDEAHALGVLGQGGRGLAWGLPAVTLVSGTFGKAFGGGGAFLASDALVGDWLLQRSGGFRYTTALAPPLAAGALAALELLKNREASGQEAGPALLERARRWRDGLAAAGWPRPAGHGPILALLVGDDQGAPD
ncbi:aminotransferase class I/II-fold pyridoxal phosphate-dependent enzyme, partial [Synechococcus sp. CCY9201]|uniref:aminotransferase class I/II-fold pyridoxal phosphate-dependent enzyme n=1 Tax=Synechococcus sp. CCY9201 TaxID=174697 RepID=UPI002B1EB6BE